MGERERDANQRDLNQSFQSEYLRQQLAGLSLTSSLNSLTANPNPNANASDRSLDYERSSIGSALERDLTSLLATHHQHYQQRLSLDRNPSASDVSQALNIKPSKERSNGWSKRETTHFEPLSSTDYSLIQFDDSSVGYSSMSGVGGETTIRRHYQSLIRKNETLRAECETLQKRYADLVGAHGAAVSKLELAQEEHTRLCKSYEESVQERNAAVRDRNSLQQQCTAAIRQWDKALRENNELKEQLAKVQQQRDEAMKEINQAMAARIKAAKDSARYADERNAAVQEYSLVMSERDAVHKEIEKLQEEQSKTQKRVQQLESEKKVMADEIESLKREISSAMFDRDRAMKVCNDLREKYGDYSTGITDDTAVSPVSASRAAHNFWGSSSSGVSSSWAQIMSKGELKSSHVSAASSNSSMATFSSPPNPVRSYTRLENLDQANAEIELLRKQAERRQTDFDEAQQEVEVSKRRRDWAFSERDKVVLERESIRTLCDKLRRERDRAVSDLAEALRDVDEIKRQRNETAKELKDWKAKMEPKMDKESRVKANQQPNPEYATDSSRDSAIDADMQEFEIETVDINLKKAGKSAATDWWGFRITADEKGVYITEVLRDSIADGKLKVNDCVTKINETIIRDMKAANEALKKTGVDLKLVVQRKRATRFMQTINYSVDSGQEHGIALERGFYVSRISSGSVAAKEGNLAVGDRVLYINGKSLDDSSTHDAIQLLRNSSTIVLQIMKTVNYSVPQLNSTNSNANSGMSGADVSQTKSVANVKERQRKMVSCCSQTEDRFAPHPNRPSVPIGYQSLSRSTGKRNSALINGNNKLVSPLSSFSVSPTSSSAGHEVTHQHNQSTPAPTLLDKAYSKIFGDRKQTIQAKQQTNGFCEDESQTLAELDEVLDKYSKGKSNSSGKYTKMAELKKTSKSKKDTKEKNGDTWPKYRAHPTAAPALQAYGYANAVTTMRPQKRKERKSLLANFGNIVTAKSDKTVSHSPQSSAACEPPANSSRNNDTKDDDCLSPSSFLSFEPASEAALIAYQHRSKPSSATYSSVSSSASQSNPSATRNQTLDSKLYKQNKPSNNSSLDYSVVSGHSSDKRVLDYYKKRAAAKPARPHSLHGVLGDMPAQAYDSFSPSSTVTSPPASASIPIPPPRNSGSFAYYALNNVSQPHSSHLSTVSHSSRGAYQPPLRHLSTSPHSLLTPYIFRSGDSLLSGNEHHWSHSRSVSAYPGGVHRKDNFKDNVKDNLVNRYSITPSPSPSQYSGGTFSGPSPSNSFDIVSPAAVSGAHSHYIQSKRLFTHANHFRHSSVANNAGGGDDRSHDENSFAISPIDGLSTFPKRNQRNQRFRIPSNPSVTSKSSAGKLSTSSIEKASSSILSDRGSPTPFSFHIEWHSPRSGSSSNSSPNGNERRAKPGEVRSIYIEKSSQLGIQISASAHETGGTFVSHVTENSVAYQAGLLVGDQLLEVCGINLRNATYSLAANVLRQCGDRIVLLVQYNPDKYSDNFDEAVETDDEVDDDDDDDMDDEDEDVGDDTNDSTSTSTPQKPIIVRANTNINEEDMIPSSAASTLTRPKVASRSASNASRTTEKTITNSIGERQSINSFQQSSTACEPRRIIIKKPTSNLGISLVGGNAVGIFIHSIRDDSLAGGANGLKPGDQILEYNGVDLRNATAEEAAIELAKPAETISLVAQYNMERCLEIQDQQGDSFYIRAAIDRPSADGSLAFRKDDILLVDNTMFNGVPGLWRAWLVDQEGQKVKCGVIPSKYKIEEELLLRRSLRDSSGDRSGGSSARRSFFRRRKNNHQRSSSRESAKELASFSDVSINGCSDFGAVTVEAIDQLLPASYIRVERLSYETTRPVIIIGPLMEVLFDKLEQDFPHTFQRCIPEVMRGSQQMMERWLQELKLVDYRRRGSHFECTTIGAVKEICDKNLHALLDVSPASVERLNRCHIYPVVVYLKFKSTKQIREIKDHRYPDEKVTSKAAKEMYEHSLKIESEYKDLINVVIPGSNLAYVCTQVKTRVDEEQSKALWVQS